MITDLFKDLSEATKALLTPQELAAIWLSIPLRTAGGKTLRITSGDKIKVVNDGLVDCDDEPTHEIISCIGSLYPPFEIKIRNLETDLITQISL